MGKHKLCSFLLVFMGVLCNGQSGFKKEKELEVWARNKGEEGFEKLLSYDICQTSGLPGPKRKQGDLLTAYELFQSNHQLPEITFLSNGGHTIQ